MTPNSVLKCKSFRFASLAAGAAVLFTLATACSTGGGAGDEATHVAKEINAADSHILYSGRYEIGDDAQGVIFGHSGNRARMRFEGTSVAARLFDETGDNYMVVFIDGQMSGKIHVEKGEGTYTIADGLSRDEAHTVELVRATECNLGLTHFKGFILPEGGNVLEWTGRTDRKIEFIGDSVTCAYGVEAESEKVSFTPETENFCLGYAGLTVRALDADYLIMARSGIGIFRNYDGPSEGSKVTMPVVYPYSFYMNEDYEWDFSRFVPDVVCINIGPNDYSTSGVDEEKFVSHFNQFVDTVAGKYPEAKLVIIEGPMGSEEDPVTVPLKKALDRVMAHLEETAPGRASFLWLSPEGKVGFGADWHPNKAQSEINAAELTEYLSKLMGWE